MKRTGSMMRPCTIPLPESLSIQEPASKSPATAKMQNGHCACFVLRDVAVYQMYYSNTPVYNMYHNIPVYNMYNNILTM